MASFSLLKKADLKLLKDKAIDLGCNISYLEKDYYAVHLIKCLQTFIIEDGSFIFTGGTALAKAYKLLDRFSEDCDFILLKSGMNRTNLSNLRKKLENYLNQEGFLVQDNKSKNENKNWIFEIKYERLSSIEGETLRPELKLEIIHKNKEEIKITDLSKKSVQSFLAESKQGIPEVTSIDCLSIEEICAGKLSALIWRYLLKEDKAHEPQHIRHLCDIAILTPNLSNSHRFKEIFNLALEEDLKKRTKSTKKLSEILEQMWEELNINIEHKENYQNYVKNYIYSSSHNPLSFEEAVKRLRILTEPFV